MKFTYPNAFSINLLGGGRAFPFCFEIEKDEEVFGVSVYSTQLISIADIVEKYAEKFIVAFDTDHYWSDEVKGFSHISAFSRVAKSQEIEFIEYDEETIGFEKKFLIKLLTDFNHYNFNFFDSANAPSFEQVYEDYFICKSHDWKSDKKLLPKLNNSSVYVSSHDDCYLYFETKNLNFVKEVFVRNLQFLVVTKDYQNRLSENELESFDEMIEVEIVDLPNNFLNDFFSETKPITIFQENIVVDERKIRLPICLKKFDMYKEQEYEIEGFISYDFNEHQWNIEDLANE